MKIKISTLKKITAVGFITLFAAFLVLPNTGLPRSKENAAIVARENRKITAFPTASTYSKKFYTEFEKWYQDRLMYRDKIIGAWKQGNFDFGVMLKDNIVVGKNNWLLNKNNCIRNFNDGKKKLSKIKSLQNYCQKQGKKFILIVPPNKESAYRDYFPENIQAKYKPPEHWQKEAEKQFKKYRINYLSVTDAIAKQRKTETQDLYFFDDHHWSYYGASTAADLLLKKLNKDLRKNFYHGLKLDGTTKTATKERSYANQLGIKADGKIQAPWSKQYTDEIYLTDCYTNKTEKVKGVVSNNYLWGRIVKGEGIVTNKAVKNNVKLLILGDSYSSYMVPYLSQNVKQIVSTHYNRVAEKKKEVNMHKLLKKYNPDAVVLIVEENAFFHSKADNLFKNLKF